MNYENILQLVNRVNIVERGSPAGWPEIQAQ